MSTVWLIAAVAVAVVGFFVIGLSLTIIFKGHNIESEIGENNNMKKLGIKCAAQQIREEERELIGGEACGDPLECSPDGCSSCGIAVK